MKAIKHVSTWGYQGGTRIDLCLFNVAFVMSFFFYSEKIYGKKIFCLPMEFSFVPMSTESLLLEIVLRKKMTQKWISVKKICLVSIGFVIDIQIYQFLLSFTF